MEQFVAEEVGAENVSLVSIKEYIKKSQVSVAEHGRAGPVPASSRAAAARAAPGLDTGLELARLPQRGQPPAPAVTERNGKV